MKRAIAAALLTTPLLLAAGCGSLESSAINKSVTTIESPVNVKEKLDETNYQCGTWQELSDTYAKCTMDRDGSKNGGGVLSISKTESSPELYASYSLDQEDDLTGSVWADNWAGTCSEDVGSDTCRNIAATLGVNFTPQL